MKVLHTADLHIGALAGDLRLDESGLQHRVQITLDMLDYLIDYANQSCQVLVLAGDNFDTHNPSTRLLFEFNKRIQTTKVPVIIILGQHDLPKSCRSHNAFPYQYNKNSLIFVVTKPKTINISGFQFVCIPYSQQILMDDNWRHLNHYLKYNSTSESIIITHFPFTGAKISDKFALRSGLPKAVFDDVKFKKALLGDIHRAQILGADQKVFYPGSPIYVSRAESGDKGFFVHDLTQNTHEFIKLNPEILPELKQVIKQKKERPTPTNKVVIKELLKKEFGQNTNRMIAILEEIGMGEVLSNSIYAAG
ncbi:metallophosphoesterase [Candidatus Babeliales bacterium]|nr:metallophosphoesterase [Candidatus Babeliales bacterium]